MTKQYFLIYGAYGYTGKQIAALAKQSGLIPTLAGRNKEKLLALSTSLNLPYRVFDITDLEATKAAIRDFICVIHCAGPFIHTYKNMVEACLAVGTHYLDITGEVRVLENLAALNSRALDANIMVLPGAGFDVVPSDCLAQHLKTRLPDAVTLTMAIRSVAANPTQSGVSRGTLKSMVEGLAHGTMIRDNGKLIVAPAHSLEREFQFDSRTTTTCALISWGDISTAWVSTQIPHIETYMAMPKKFNKLTHFIKPFKGVLTWKPMQKLFAALIHYLPEGPTPEQQAQTKMQIFGEVTNPAGMRAVSFLETPEGYQFTALSAIHLVKKVIAGNAPHGFQTPSLAYGEDVALEIPGVQRKDLN